MLSWHLIACIVPPLESALFVDEQHMITKLVTLEKDMTAPMLGRVPAIYTYTTDTSSKKQGHRLIKF